jgi:hypothetical protein
MRLKIYFGIVLLYTTTLLAQNADSTQAPPTWIKGGLSSLTFSQVSLTNWAAGGQNSSSVNSFLSLFADKRKDRVKWQNSIDLGYGVLKQGEGAVIKSDDRINFSTKYGYQAIKGNDHWFINGFLDFRTQFAPGFSQDDPDSVISRFLAPAYITVGSGIEYSPNKYISFAYTPIAGKITIVNDAVLVGSVGAYGVKAGETTRAELGSFFRFNYKQEAMKNVNIDMRLDLFTNYEKENFGNIDVNWQNSIVMRVNKYITTNLFNQLIYDDDITTERVDKTTGDVVNAGPKTQFKSVFGVGIAYTFGDTRIKE